MKKAGKRLPAPIALLILLGTSLLVILVLIRAVGLPEDMEQRRVDSVQAAVMSAARECYAVEGIYPRDLEYLENHYGLVLNHRRYIVSYECFASNEAPEVRVLKR